MCITIISIIMMIIWRMIVYVNGIPDAVLSMRGDLQQNEVRLIICTYIYIYIERERDVVRLYYNVINILLML